MLYDFIFDLISIAAGALPIAGAVLLFRRTASKKCAYYCGYLPGFAIPIIAIALIFDDFKGTHPLVYTISLIISHALAGLFYTFRWIRR